jgi:serine/threonine protein kinase
MDWPTRQKICLGIASGLQYIHEDSQPPLIHRDIKASNILLDKYFHAKIADFGLTKIYEEDLTHITTVDIVGTRLVFTCSIIV